MSTLAILLTVHNRRENTLRCLQCVNAQLAVSGVEADIYMTDDGCTDGTAEAVSKRFPEVRIIKGDGNLYWNRGMIAAWEAAVKRKDYDYYLWLNDDTYIKPDAINNILQSSAETGDNVIIAGATKSAKTGQTTYGLRGDNGHRLTPDGTLQSGHDLNGNFVLIPKSVYSKLGMLDAHYHHAGGDTDYGLRAKEADIGVLLDKDYCGTCEEHPTLSVWCNPDHPLTERWRSLNHPLGMPLRTLFYHERRHYGLPTACFHVCTTIAHCLWPKLWIRLKL